MCLFTEYSSTSLGRSFRPLSDCVDGAPPSPLSQQAGFLPPPPHCLLVICLLLFEQYRLAAAIKTVHC